jgi:hypothetical protein
MQELGITYTAAERAAMRARAIEIMRLEAALAAADAEIDRLRKLATRNLDMQLAPMSAELALAQWADDGGPA